MSVQKISKQEAVFRDRYRGRSIEVHLGWDRALQRHYLQVQYADGKCESVYCSDEDVNVTRYTDLTYFLRYLLQLGVHIPRDAVRAVSTAPMRSFGTAQRSVRDPATNRATARS
jgi:hypothetical protein